jgi:hypothetical protein
MRYRNAWIYVGSPDAGFVIGQNLCVRSGTFIGSID